LNDIYIYINEQIIGELSCVRCCCVCYGMGLDFLTCNSDIDRRAYIDIDQNKIKKIIVIIDKRWEKLESVNSCMENRGKGKEDVSSSWERRVN
jgi:hypothetical protein